MPKLNLIDAILKDACELSGATWAVCVERNKLGWTFRGVFRLRKKKRDALEAYLANEEIDRWLADGLKSRRSRSQKLVAETSLGVPYLYSFPLSSSGRLYLVGSEKLPTEKKKIWRLASKTYPLFPDSPTLQANDVFTFGGQANSLYDLPNALDRILTRLRQYVPADGGWLALYGERKLRVEAVYHAIETLGTEIEIAPDSALFQVIDRRSSLRWDKDDQGWQSLGLDDGVSWIALPLIVGHRLVGVVTLWRKTPFSEADWLTAQHLSVYAAASVDMFVTFAEMADHLKRQAMLNDFALVISSAQDLNQIVRRVFSLLVRAFNTKNISLFLLSSDGRTLREFKHLERRAAPRTEFVKGHPIAKFIRQGKNLRIENAQNGEYPFSSINTRSAFIVSLKYRGEIIGLLSLESELENAFSGYDENLLVVIASHLSGLVEYGRLRDEAEVRARNLGLIHEVIQQVIGLTNIEEVAQITADILVQYFSYELAAVLLVNRDNELRISGISGKAATHIETTLNAFENPVQGGVTGYVYDSGESVMIDDVNKHAEYVQIPGWEAGSEICVALKDGDRVLGVIDVESSAQNAFNHNDLLALESLAGFLTSAISSVDRYQMLQDTIQILQTTQEELNERMEAQREAENRLVQAAKLAAVGEMAAGVAHELNNPLTTVAGFSELVLDDLPPESPQREDLALVLREATRARNVVRRLLDFARQSESVRARADINEVVEDVAALMRHLFETSNVDFSLNLDETLPWVFMDRDQIKQVVLNLLHNALHAMPEGGSLSVSTETKTKKDAAWVVMHVQDSGKGITPNDLARIFEPFFTTNADNGGTGLGLAVSYGIITDHQGFIDVESAPNEGACFSVWLPIEEKAA